MQSVVDVSYLADCVILLRYYEALGQIHKAISIVKKRSGVHETAIRDFRMTKGGILIGDPLDKFRGILLGVPQFERVSRGGPEERQA